ncbi:hypothetical protein APU02_12765 [Citrobacter sp. 50677481]|nr:hypothetical protein APU02_12765 [Citrobacter sp. 50677481]
MTSQLAFLVPSRHPRPANYAILSTRGQLSRDELLRRSLQYSDQDNPSIRLAYQLVKQIFALIALIVINLLAKKLTDLLHY